MVVGYGLGKSTIYFGSAVYFGGKLHKKVLIVYANNGLLNKDQALLVQLITYCEHRYKGFK